ncbi:MAG: glycosyltransferase [Thermoplasmata archaeon]|nr:glycosyltransferase [Thermoplasmata archaeon]
MRSVTTLVPLPPSYRGGTEEYAYRVAGEVSKHRPVRVLTTRVREGHDRDPVPTGGATLETLEAFELWERPVVHGRKSREALRKAVEDSSLLHLHMPFPFVERRLTRWAAEAGVPTVLTYHMDAHFGGRAMQGLVNSAYRKLSAEPALERASVAVSNSMGYARASPVLSRHLEKVRVIHKGVDLNRLGVGTEASGAADASPLPAAWSEATGPKLLFVGRLVPYKGLPVLIEGFARYRARANSGTLFIAGRGPQERRLREQVQRAGLTAHVHFLGFVPDRWLGRLYQEADLVACTSVSLLESTPTALEEAAALGTPILGPRLPGIEESLPIEGGRGALVAPYDIDGASREIARLLKEGVRAAPAHPRSWSAVAEEYLQLYEELERNRPGG